MKKVLVLTLVLCLSLGTLLVGYAAEQKDYSIHLITMDTMDQHWQTCWAGAQEAAKELGIKVVFNSPDTKDDNKQNECINNSVGMGANGILLAANSPTSPVSAMKEAVEAGVKLLYVDSPAEYETPRLFATDNRAGGLKIGQRLLQELTEKGITTGKVGIIGVNPSTESCNTREYGFRDAFEGTAFELLETQYGEGDASRSKEIADNYIAQGCIAVYGSNEGSTVGAGNAAKEAHMAGIDVVACGSDSSDTNIALIKDGSLLCIMGQNPFQMGYQGVYAMVDYLNGTLNEAYEYVDTGVNVIELANVDQF